MVLAVIEGVDVVLDAGIRNKATRVCEVSGMW